MENEKVRILAIAPYEAMKTAIERLAQKRSDFDLQAYVGDLDAGKALVQREVEKPYDVIISRGGTARLIETITDLPVIDISLSVYDILRAIKLAENYQERYAIIGFPNITESAHMLCDLLQYDLDIFTVHSEAEVEPLLQRLSNDGYHMVVCDMISYTEARELGLNAILITSGVESIEDAFTQAVKVSASQIRTRRENAFFRRILADSHHLTIIFDQNDQVFFSSMNGQNPDQLITQLTKELPQIRQRSSKKLMRSIADTWYTISGILITDQDRSYVAFDVTESVHTASAEKFCINYENCSEAQEHFYNSFYSMTGAMGDLEDTVNNFSQSPFPILITGENGTGKEQIARALYLRSPLVTHPFITIDCGRMTDKAWSHLTEHYKSPLFDSDNTLFFQNLNLLSDEQRNQLLNIIIDSNLHRRNRLIFSAISARDTKIPAECQTLIKNLSCITICLPPLRERILELPNLSSIYLSSLNVDLGKQLSGFEPKAMAMLTQYDWPENYSQFKRLAAELAVLTDTAYITSNTVASLLDKERTAVTAAPTSQASGYPDLERPLEDITRDLIKQAVANNQGNQSLTAKQLNISRTTLWRYLKE